ncbi:MAG: HAMP domain-containing sensor histidine kinase [Pseudomonadota bacterium]
MEIEAQKLSQFADAPLEERLQRAFETGRSEGDEQAELPALLNHQLRTPLNAVLAFADLLSDDDGDLCADQKAAFLGHLRDGDESLGRLTEQALQFASADFGRINLNETAFPAREAVQAAATDIERQAAKRSIRIDCEAPSEAMLIADRDHVVEIITSLLSNAVKFSEVGSVVRVWAHEASDGSLTVVVEDDGCGLGDLGDDALFSPFQGGETVKKRIGEGLGLGLPLAKRLAEAHRASIRVTNRAEGGVRAEVAFPSNRCTT